MKSINQNIPLHYLSYLDKLEELEKILFLDIETTGFCTTNSHIALVGILFIQKNLNIDSSPSYIGTIQQFFIETLMDELEVLKKIGRLLKNFKTIITFKGESFDLKFIQTCALQYHIPSPISHLKSIDLYYILKPYQKILGLNSMKQEEIEKLSGFSRSYIEKNWILQYQKYLTYPSHTILKSLLQHNLQNLESIYYLISLHSIPTFFHSSFKFQKKTQNGDTLTLEFISQEKIYFPIEYNFQDMEIKISSYLLSITLPIYQGEAKYYFKDYQNYFYLIQEDTAIHKSLAQFVDKSLRIKAKKNTAYIKKFSKYLPIYGESPLHIFQLEEKKSLYIELEEFYHSANRVEYLYHLLVYCKLRK